MIANMYMMRDYIVMCQRGGVSNTGPVLLRQDEPGMSQYIHLHGFINYLGQ